MQSHCHQITTGKPAGAAITKNATTTITARIPRIEMTKYTTTQIVQTDAAGNTSENVRYQFFVVVHDWFGPYTTSVVGDTKHT